MSLPVIDHPTFVTTLPISNDKVTFRPMLCKEEKLLLIARESNDRQEIINALKQVATNCTAFNNQQYNFGEFAVADFEHLILQIRARSVGEEITLHFEDCDQPVTVNINDIKVNVVTNEQNDCSMIKINDNVGLVLTPPTVDTILGAAMSGPTVDTEYSLLVSLIDTVYDSENTYKMSDYTLEEQKQFVESLPQKTVGEIIKYVRTIPYLDYTVKYKNIHGVEKEVGITDIVDFFT